MSTAIFLVDGAEYEFHFAGTKPISEVVDEVSERVGFRIDSYPYEQDDEGRYVIDRRRAEKPISWGLASALRKVMSR